MKIPAFFLLIAFAIVPMACRSQDSAAAAAAITNAPTPEAAEQTLENAPGRIVSTPASASANDQVAGPTAEIAKLAQAGVGESVMLNYVATTGPFNLTSDDIVYLNDLGVSTNVVNAMMERDQTLQAQNPALASQPPAYNNPPPATAPLTPPLQEEAPAPVNASYTYFYDSLAPYGNWIDIGGYGWCWQPTAVVVDSGWQPYCDRGRWVYSDCGWYWASDYSWGWAPFHYGRWFRSARFGWCWAPDTVWGPSWVTWRYGGDYCGWAPLPPVACFSPGVGFTFYGRHVAANFNFGIGIGLFTFVPFNHCFDPHPWRFRVPRGNVTRIYNRTTIINNFTVVNNRVINRGVPVSHIENATHTRIRTVNIRETSDPRIGRGERVERSGRTLTVYRPSLPTPPRNARFAGEGVRPAPREGHLMRGITPPERAARAEVRNQWNEIRNAPAESRSLTPTRREAIQPQPRREISPRETAPPPRTAPLTPREERRGGVAPNTPQQPMQPAAPRENRRSINNSPTRPQSQPFAPRNVPQTAPLTPRGMEREQRVQPQREQRFAAPPQFSVPENRGENRSSYRQETPRYEAPRETPRYEVPRESPRFEAPRNERPAPSYRFESPRQSSVQPSAPAARGGSGGQFRGGGNGQDRNRNR